MSLSREVLLVEVEGSPKTEALLEKMMSVALWP